MKIFATLIILLFGFIVNMSSLAETKIKKGESKLATLIFDEQFPESTNNTIPDGLRSRSWTSIKDEEWGIGYYVEFDSTLNKNVIYGQWINGEQGMPASSRVGSWGAGTNTRFFSVDEWNNGITIYSIQKFHNWIYNGTGGNCHPMLRANVTGYEGNGPGEVMLESTRNGYGVTSYPHNGLDIGDRSFFVSYDCDGITYNSLLTGQTITTNALHLTNDQISQYVEDDVWYETVIFIDTGFGEGHSGRCALWYRIYGETEWTQLFDWNESNLGTGQGIPFNITPTNPFVGFGPYLHNNYNQNEVRAYLGQITVWSGDAMADGLIPDYTATAPKLVFDEQFPEGTNSTMPTGLASRGWTSIRNEEWGVGYYVEFDSTLDKNVIYGQWINGEQGMPASARLGSYGAETNCRYFPVADCSNGLTIYSIQKFHNWINNGSGGKCRTMLYGNMLGTEGDVIGSLALRSSRNGYGFTSYPDNGPDLNDRSFYISYRQNSTTYNSIHSGESITQQVLNISNDLISKYLQDDVWYETVMFIDFGFAEGHTGRSALWYRKYGEEAWAALFDWNATNLGSAQGVPFNVTPINPFIGFGPYLDNNYNQNEVRAYLGRIIVWSGDAMIAGLVPGSGTVPTTNKLEDLEDVEVTNLQDNDFLAHMGTKWTNIPRSVIDDAVNTIVTEALAGIDQTIDTKVADAVTTAVTNAMNSYQTQFEQMINDAISEALAGINQTIDNKVATAVTDAMNSYQTQFEQMIQTEVAAAVTTAMNNFQAQIDQKIDTKVAEALVGINQTIDNKVSAAVVASLNVYQTQIAQMVETKIIEILETRTSFSKTYVAKVD